MIFRTLMDEVENVLHETSRDKRSEISMNIYRWKYKEQQSFSSIETALIYNLGFLLIHFLTAMSSYLYQQEAILWLLSDVTIGLPEILLGDCLLLNVRFEPTMSARTETAE